MIRLTRLNNQPIAVNADLIKYVENSPDTLLTLVTGDKMVVRESEEEVIRRVVEYRRSLISPPMPQLVRTTTDATTQSE